MRALLDRLTIVLFALALAAPTLDQLVRPDAARDCRRAERREPSPRPELSRRSLEEALREAAETLEASRAQGMNFVMMSPEILLSNFLRFAMGPDWKESTLKSVTWTGLEKSHIKEEKDLDE